jgi:hypothetical protein
MHRLSTFMRVAVRQQHRSYTVSKTIFHGYHTCLDSVANNLRLFEKFDTKIDENKPAMEKPLNLSKKGPKQFPQILRDFPFHANFRDNFFKKVFAIWDCPGISRFHPFHLK